MLFLPLVGKGPFEFKLDEEDKAETFFNLSLELSDGTCKELVNLTFHVLQENDFSPVFNEPNQMVNVTLCENVTIPYTEAQVRMVRTESAFHTEFDSVWVDRTKSNFLTTEMQQSC